MAECKNEKVTRAQAAGLTVRDAMNVAPKALPGDSTVADLRALFENPHVRTALLLEGSTFLGVVNRDAVPAAGSEDLPARDFATRDVTTIGPDAPLTDALKVMDEREERRVPVLDQDGSSLVGLLCLTGDREGFCQS